MPRLILHTPHPSGSFSRSSRSSDASSRPRLSESSGIAPDETASGRKIYSGRIELREEDCWNDLPYEWRRSKKWAVLAVVCAVQISMNLNVGMYFNAVPGVADEFHVDYFAARAGEMAFLVAYALASGLWAPWSEEYGRWPVMQLSLGLVNIWQLPVALAPNYTSVIVGRLLGGLSSAGGTVTLGMVADVWEPEDQQYAIALAVFASVSGSAIGPIAGGYIQQYLDWTWIFWIQLIVGCIVQLLHFFTPETRTTIVIDELARRGRKSGKDLTAYGPSEMRPPMTLHQSIAVQLRPFIMFVREPIVLFTSLLSGLSDSIIFTIMTSAGLIFAQWDFTASQKGLAFISILAGYALCYAGFLPFYRKEQRAQKTTHHMTKSTTSLPASERPEHRLLPLLYLAPFLPASLLTLAFTATGPPLPWIAPLIPALFLATANFAIYLTSIDYTVATYGSLAASATAGNAICRNVLSGAAALYAVPLFKAIDPSPDSPVDTSHDRSMEIRNALLVLAGLALCVTIPLYLLYTKAEAVRRSSRFALVLEKQRAESVARRMMFHAGPEFGV